jgi:D-serine dehydratase
MTIEAGTKGLPANIQTIRLGDIGKAGWKLHSDLQLPAAVLRRSALENNGAWMRRFSDHFGVALCPHGKTTMAPQLFDRQLRDGSWGLSCATIAHLRLYRRFGVQRIIFANQIVSSRAAAWLAGELAADAAFEAYVFVDSKYGADLLADAARAAGLDRPITVLVEIGAEGCRTGVRGLDAAISLARHVAGQPGLALAGVATFEGIVPGRTDRDMEPYVEALLADTVRAAEMMARARLFRSGHPVILSAGGSRFFDLAALRLRAADVGESEPLMVLRSGCYISHDSHQYEIAFERLLQRSGKAGLDGRLRNALEVWAEVQSRPEPGWMFANIGRRDISYDADMPDALAAWRREGNAVEPISPGTLKVRKLSDQHAHITIEQTSPLAIGDQIGFGVSHPCTTFDKWRILYEVDDSGLVVDAIATFF